MSDQSRLQEVYNELHEQKEERKKLKEMLKDELKHHERYGEIKEELDGLKAEKKGIETQVQNANAMDAAKLEELTIEIKANEELLSDLALNLLMKNEEVELTDKHANRYVPQFVVKFKKDGMSEKNDKV